MSQIAQQCKDSPPTLFHLKSLDVQTILSPAFRRPRRAARLGKRMSINRPHDVDERLLRFDSPQPVYAPHSSSVRKTERRLERLTGQSSLARDTESGSDPTAGDTSSVASVQVIDATTEWFHDHAGDLISGLGMWSLKLDRRESELDRREHELNRRSRLLRQNQCVA